MPKTQQQLFDQIADALDPATERSKEERMNLLLSALYDMNDNVKKPRPVKPEAIDAKKLVEVINATADLNNEGINDARRVLTAVMGNFELYGFSPKMSPLFVNNLYKKDALSIIPKFPIEGEKETTNAILVDFVRSRVKSKLEFVFSEFGKSIIDYLKTLQSSLTGEGVSEIPAPDPKSDDIIDYSENYSGSIPKKANSKLEEYLQYTELCCKTNPLIQNSEAAQGFYNEGINSRCLFALTKIKSIIEDTDWTLGKWGSNSMIEVNGGKKEIPKHMKEIHDKIKHAEQNPKDALNMLKDIHEISERALSDKPTIFKKFRERSQETRSAYEEIANQSGKRFEI
ncbi:hypothetical protein [Legionella waltersii]|uniref:Uncharacterized protein n=1 Tax=Legionella waltersii TaxID=66969 RepID=A0A0W1AAK1_9GAMM|nr:hypothetical protein [Legionella waltersii]KTD78365.1 hypothetical protein Lwal_1800 [Legionella waltersii]SNV06439.1 Uncharacterised protein [Legionella waltersii]